MGISGRYGYQGNQRERYGYSSFHDDHYGAELLEDESEEKDARSARTAPAATNSLKNETVNTSLPQQKEQSYTTAHSDNDAVADETKEQKPESEASEKSQSGSKNNNTKKETKEGKGLQPPQASKNQKGGGGFGGGNGGDGSGGGGLPEGGKGEVETPEADTSDSNAFINSLAENKPSSFIKGMETAGDNISEARKNEKTDLKESLPEMEQPTGLPVHELPQSEESKTAENNKLPDVKVTGKEDGKKIKEEHKQAPEVHINVPPPKPVGDKIDESTFLKSVSQIPDSDESVNTSAGPRPNVDMSGQADPQQNDQNEVLAGQEVTELKSNSDNESNKDFGENDVFPDVKKEILKPSGELLPPGGYSGQSSDTIPEDISQESLAAFDAGAQTELDQKSAAELQKADEAKLKMEEDSDKERENSDKKIKEETDKTTELQKAEQNKAKSEVKGHRESWKKENEDLQKEFKNESETKKKETQGKIDTEVSTTDAKVESELSTAEKQANEEKQRSQDEAQRKKDEAKNQKKSFWDKVADAVSDFFDKLKEAVNFIFNKLRAFVKKVIEAAKKAVNAMIDLARKAIIGLIKAFGELLKKLVSVLLAAFPELRKKFCDLIDKLVDAACDMVNKLADALKKAVNFLLDALGKVLDAILAAYQALYNALLDAMKFIAVGLIKIMRGLWNIVKSLGPALDSIGGALVKEFIGEDVTSPLPSVEASDAELPILVKMQQEYLGAKTEKADEGVSPMPAAQFDEGLASKEKLADSDFELEEKNPVDLDPKLLSSLPDLADGETLELGGSSEPVTAKDLSQEVFGGAEESAPSAVPAAQDGPSGAETAGVPAGVDMEWLAKSDDEKLQHHIDLMGADAEQPNPKEKSGAGAAQVDTPIETKTGRLGVGKRLAFVGQQMMKGMSMWWQQNKVTVYMVMIGVLVGAGVVAFFTGGAGLIALVQLLLQALTVMFIAEAVMRIKGHVFDWLGKAWDGDVQGGGQSLAQALAVLFSEFLFEYVLKGIGKALKNIKKTLKATKLGKKISRGVRKMNVAVRKTIRKVTKPMKGITSKGGKYVLKMKQGIGKGVKKLEDLRERILSKFGFKRIWFERHGQWFELWGEFNAKVLLSKTKKRESEIVDIDSEKIKKQLRSQQVLGQEVKVGRKKGIVISDTDNSFSRSLEEKSAKELSDAHDDLSSLSDIDRRKKIAGGVSERVSLRKDVEEEIWQKALDENFNKKLKQFIDPNTGKPIPHLEPPQYFPKGHPCEGLRKPRADIGHKSGDEWKKRLADHKEKGHTREEIIEAENNADLYHIEDRSSNRGHGFEED